MDINDLWIGDLLRLKKSGRIGKFDGLSGHKKIRVKVGEKIVLTTVSNVEYAPEATLEESPTYSNRPKKIIKTSAALSDTIDLHIEVLNPSLHSSRVERIVDFQIKAARDFIENSIDNGTRKILIIHGRGEGVLKSEVLHLLSLYDEVQYTFDKHNGGATEVWFDI